MFISGESGLPLSLLIKRIPPSNFDDNIMFFSRASGGMEFFLRSTGVNPKKKKVLLPNYICWDFVKSIVKIGYEPVFYQIDDTFNPVLDDLFGKMSSEIFAVVIVHYFGFYCPLTEKIVGRCRENGIYAVEDCAHLMYGKDIRKNMKGDVAIFSLKKQFPIPDGGILYDNTGVVEGKNSLREIPRHKLNIGKNTSKLILKYYMQKINFVKKKYSPIDDDMESMSYLKIKRISDLSENLFMKIRLLKLSIFPTFSICHAFQTIQG